MSIKRLPVHRFFVYSAALAIVMLVPGFCSAHGLGYSVLGTQGTTFACKFSTGDPVSYAQVLVYSPEKGETEFQNGRTDAQGTFSFLPNRPGIWNIIVNAGMGHKLDFALTVTHADLQNRTVSVKPSSESQTTISKTLLALSLLTNLFLFGKLRNLTARK